MVKMIKLIKLQLWNVSVGAANTTKGFSIVTKRGATAAKAEEIAMVVSANMGPTREARSVVRTCEVYAEEYHE